MSNVTVRPMHIRDVRFAASLEGSDITAKMLADEVLYNTMAHYFIAERCEERLGYIGVWITDPNAEITHLTVREDRRRQGVGETLINRAIAFCKTREVHDVTLEVRVSNTGAIALYEKKKFARVAIRKNYYSNGEDAVLMRLKVRDAT